MTLLVALEAKALGAQASCPRAYDTMDELVAFDYRCFQAINGLALRSNLLDSPMIGVAKYSPVLLALALLGLWASWRPALQRGAFLAGASALSALGFGQVIGRLFPRPRPYLMHQIHQLIAKSTDTSFPSDHAILGFSIAVMIWMFDRRAGYALVAFAVLLAFARVFVGAHYPSDVFGGAIVGGLTSILVRRLAATHRVSRFLDWLMTMMSRWRVAATPGANRSQS